MKTQNTFAGTHTGTIRAGVISLLVPILGYLWLTGLGDAPRMWLFMVSFAVCVVLMAQSIVDLLVLGFGVAARFSGTVIGRSIRVIRSHARNAA